VPHRFERPKRIERRASRAHVAVCVALASCGGSVVRPPAAPVATATTAAATAPPLPPLPAAPPASPPTPAASPSVTERGDLAELDAREAPVAPVVPIDSDAVHGAVESAAPPVVTPATDGGALRIQAPLGPAASVTCWVYPRVFDPGAQLARVIRGAEKAVDMQRVVVREVVVAGDYPAMFVDALYAPKPPAAKAVGILKVMVVASEAAPMLCLHDQVGYHASFKRVALGLARSLRVDTAHVKTARYATIGVRTVDGRAIQFSRRAIYDVEGGGKISEERLTEFDPRSPTDLGAVDTVRSEEWDSKGAVQSLAFVKGAAGVVSERIGLKRANTRDYSFEGTHLGAHVEGTFRTKAPEGLVGDATVFDRTNALFAPAAPAAPPPEFRVERYEPTVDLAAPVEFTFRLLSRPDRTVTVAYGTLQVTAVVDANGRIPKVETSSGTSVFRLERVFERGSP
jgi:hypothetical protein